MTKKSTNPSDQQQKLRLYGFDPGFRHGAVVSAVYQIEGSYTRISEVTPVYIWVAKSKTGFSVDTPAHALYNFCNQITRQLALHPPGLIVIDYDATSVYWRAQRMQIVQLAMFLGFFARSVLEMGFMVQFLTPKELRSALGFQKIAKEDLQEVWRSRVLIEESPLLKNSDVVDALILGYAAFSALGGDSG